MSVITFTSETQNPKFDDLERIVKTRPEQCLTVSMAITMELCVMPIL